MKTATITFTDKEDGNIEMTAEFLPEGFDKDSNAHTMAMQVLFGMKSQMQGDMQFHE